MQELEMYLSQTDDICCNESWHDVHSEHNEHYDSHVDTDATHP